MTDTLGTLIRAYEAIDVDQTTWLLGISLLPGEGIALVTHSRADRMVDNHVSRGSVLSAVCQCSFLELRVLYPRLRRDERHAIVDQHDCSQLQ